ncbi:PREDICTED: glu S.griseus protease inhibitor-like [Fragaria vesca subsp. vesca]|uniref:glu S.griseus protease inhibitor-like n=1 Tax=Fragaria vesca subsp. vesca TaxID=101020 RepID=UPI0002C2EBAF|nr:PREDICTED: glu S.griseus protease inhibitor-like [Fragaria vesca subsp. vesca]
MSDQCQSEGKSSWPELLGAQGTDAKATIESENSSVTAVIVQEGSIVTQDIRCDRVRVWVDSYGIVTRVPIIQ